MPAKLSRAVMMRAIYDVWYSDSTPISQRIATIRRIYQFSDGYGVPGYIPSQGYDWSGVRDSSDAAVERMYDAACVAVAAVVVVNTRDRRVRQNQQRWCAR